MNQHRMLTASEVARQMGVRHSCIQYWIDCRHLEANRPRPRRLLISTQSLRAFLEAGGALAHSLNPSPSWCPVVEAARAALLERWIDTAGLADLLMCSGANIYYLRRRHAFPDPVLRRGYAPDYYDRAAVRVWLDQHPVYWTQRAKDRL